MIKRLLLLTAIFGFAVSCNDYEDDFANLNDQLDGVNAKLDNIQTAVDGIAGVQLELLNINSALAAISSSIADLPTVDDITGLANLINSTSLSLAAQMDDLDADLQVVAANIIAQLAAMEDMIENGFLAVNTSLSSISANIQIIDGEISVIQTTVDANGNLISANGTKLIDLASAVSVVDGKIVNLDGKLDTVLADLTGQLSAMLQDITSQFATVNGGLDDIDTTLASNQAEALIWYLNTMSGIGRVEVDLAAIDAQNAAILQQLAGMLTVVQNGFADASSELSATETAILAEITLVQNSLATTLLEIAGLEALVIAIQNSVDVNDASVDSQLAVINALITTLQSDLTTLLESTTTIYQGDITITNQAQLDYAMELDNKVMVINGAVEVNSTFAAAGTAALTNLNAVMDKFKTVTGNVTITSTSDLTMNNLTSIGGNYQLTGVDISDAVVTAGGNATYAYSAGISYDESALTNVGGNLVITDNGSAVVDFSGIVTLGGSFTINAGAGAAGELTDTDTINLSSVITTAKLSNVLVLTLTQDKSNALSVTTSTDFTVSGSAFDVAAVTLSGANIISTLQDITGNVSAIATGLLTFAANDVGAAGAAVSVSLTSDGQNIDLNDVVATTFNVSDPGAAGDNTGFTDFVYNSITATSFTYISQTGNPANDANTNINESVNNFAGVDFTVGTTTITSLRGVRFENTTGLGCTTNGTITGDVNVITSGNGAAVTMIIGAMVGDLTVSSGQATSIKSYVVDANIVNITGDIDVNAGMATGGGTGNLLHVYFTTCDAGGNTAANTGTIVGDVSFISSSSNASDVTLHFKEIDGNLTAGSTKNVVFGSAAGPAITGDFTITKSGATPAAGATPANSVKFNTTTEVGGTISVDIDGLFNGANFKATTTRTGDMSIDAGLGITLPEFTSLGASSDGTAATTYTTTLTSLGDIVASAVIAIVHDTSITTTAGDVDLSSLTSAIGVIDVQSTTGNVNTHELSTHDGTSLTIGGVLIMVEDLVSSTGDLTLNGDLVLEDGTTTAGASPLLASWDTLIVGSDILVELPAHDDANAGTMTLTLAQTVSTNSVTISEVSAPVMTSLVLTDQSTAFALVANDFGNSAVAAYTINITGNAALDAMSFTNVDNVSGLTTAGNVDTFVVNGMDGLTAITANHTNGANPIGTKLHIIDNTSLTSYTSATSKMHEIIITGNTAMTAIDLSSYLANVGAVLTATNAATAADLATVDFVLNVTGNGLTGTFTPKDNSGTPNTALDSAELVEVKVIATHLLGFTQANSVTALADFLVGGAALSANADAADTFNSDTDFTDGINNLAEFALLND
jgi:hypothetical protein